ncbi:MAG: ATP synthase F0 subunit C [Deltaproteobacteria bacterium]|nr:ATP synthase F0 subunit C [Deltaproteobacteria bacterium]
MKKILLMTIAALLVFAGIVPMAFAEEAAKAVAGGGNNIPFFVAIAIAAGIGMGIGAFGTGIGQGNAVRGAVEGIARNPGASGKIMTAMLVGLAMIESLAIYVLVIALILLYANPLIKYVVAN